MPANPGNFQNCASASGVAIVNHCEIENLPRIVNLLRCSERPRSLLLSLGVPSRHSPGSGPGPVQVPSRVRRGPVQIRHVLCFPAFRTHPGPEVGAISRPVLVPSCSRAFFPGSGLDGPKQTSRLRDVVVLLRQGPLGEGLVDPLPAFFERGEKTPAPKISALPRERPVLLRANFVLTKDRKRPYYGHFCGKKHREGSCSKAAGGP